MEALWKVSGVRSQDHNYYQLQNVGFVFIVLETGWGQGRGRHSTLDGGLSTGLSGSRVSC